MLTQTGKTFVSIGAVALVIGIGLRYQTLAGLGLALLLAVLIGRVWIVRRPRVEARRAVVPERVRAGRPAKSQLTVTNRGRRATTGGLALETFGASVLPLELPSLQPSESVVVTTDLPTDRRGKFVVGPLDVTRTDPFGLWRSAEPDEGLATLWVHPLAHDLRPFPSGLARDLEGPESGEALEGGITFHTLREYVRGDDLRQVHWRSTAKSGKMMVRHNVDTHQPRSMVILDTRASSYSSHGFEDAVRAATSIIFASMFRGFEFRLITTDGLELDHRVPPARILDTLAEIGLSFRGSIDEVLTQLMADLGGMALTVITGDSDLTEFEDLDRFRRRFEVITIAQFTQSTDWERGDFRCHTYLCGVERRLCSGMEPNISERSHQMKRQLLLGEISAAGLLLVVAGLFYSRIFLGSGWIAPVMASVLISLVLAITVGRTSVPLFAQMALLVVGGVLMLTVFVILPSTNFSGGREVVDAFVGSTFDGWRNTLSASLPIDTQVVEPVGFVTVLCWLAGMSTGLLLRRSEPAALPILPGIILAGIALPLGAPGGFVVWFLIAALVATSLLLALVRAVPDAAVEEYNEVRVTEFVGERMLTERLLAGTPIVLLLALLAPFVASVLPGSTEDPFDPRRLRVEEVRSTSAVNPLAELKSRRDRTDTVFTLELPAPPPVGVFDRVGLVALDQFNGSSWTTDATFSAPSSDLPPVTELTVESLRVRQRFDLVAPTNPWVPHGANPAQLDANDVWFDETSGDMLMSGSVREIGYEVLSNIPVPTTEELRSAEVDRTNERYLELPPISNDSALPVLTERMSGDSDYDRLRSLENALRNDWTLVVDEESGTSLGRIDRFITEGQGYRDQFVAAFALTARQQALPSRIMVGYRIVDASNAAEPVRLTEITSQQYDAWPEIFFAGIGWVAFDPVPPTSGEGGAGDEDVTTVPEGTGVEAGPTPRQQPPEEGDDSQTDEVVERTTLRVAVVSGIFLLAFPLMVMLIVIGLKLLRRRYRQSLDDPAERVLAGWQESKDRLVESGLTITPDMTVKEIVAASRLELGVAATAPLSAIAPHVTSTIYSYGAPTTDTADLVWDEVELFDRQLNRERSRVQVAQAKVNPRPLLENA